MRPTRLEQAILDVIETNPQGMSEEKIVFCIFRAHPFVDIRGDIFWNSLVNLMAHRCIYQGENNRFYRGDKL